MFAFVLFVIVLLMVLVNHNAFAQTPPENNQHVVHFSAEKDKDTEMVLSAPGPGENLTVIVDVPVRTRKAAAPARTYITKQYVTNVQSGSNLHLRGGVSIGLGFPARHDSSFTGGLIGQIGYADSPWVLETTFRAGNCKKGVALNTGLAAMRNVAKNFRMGVGADLLYCSDVSDHPAEKADERVVGGSFRLQSEQGHFIVAASIGVGAATYPVPGDRKTAAVFYEGLSVSYLWGD
ncbi:MAG: hypothetical protein AAB797_03885 [Patescibacteria group bacterium]